MCLFNFLKREKRKPKFREMSLGKLCFIHLEKKIKIFIKIIQVLCSPRSNITFKMIKCSNYFFKMSEWLKVITLIEKCTKS